MSVIVDAMGGDHAPDDIVKGALDAARELAIEIHLVGHRNVLGGFDVSGLPITFHHAPSHIEMGESPVRALRKKTDCSIRVAARLLKKSQGAALVSAGSTGAVLAAALIEVGKVPGVERPAIACVIPTRKGDCIMIDAGANVDCRASHLLQFAYLGHAYARYVGGIERPRVGLLNIGSEAGKGNALCVEAYELLARSGLPFAGNVEPDHLFEGDADVLVTDGFAGNVMLKTSEGVSRTLMKLVEPLVAVRVEGAGDAAGPVLTMLERYSTANPVHAGAPLLGIDGAVIVTHGAARAPTMKHAVALAENFARSGAVGAIRGIRIDGATGRA